MIFVDDPYFNEPNVDLMRGTSEGTTASNGYNTEINLNTIRWAMIDQLKRPRLGFEEFTATHFKLMKHQIMKQCERWIEDCGDDQPSIKQRMVTSTNELYQLLQQL